MNVNIFDYRLQRNEMNYQTIARTGYCLGMEQTCVCTFVIVLNTRFTSTCISFTEKQVEESCEWKENYSEKKGDRKENRRP